MITKIKPSCRYCNNINFKDGCKCDKNPSVFKANLPLIDMDNPVKCDYFELDPVEYCK